MILEIRPLAFTEVATLVDWAAEEGWNPGLNDPRSFFAADPQGFLGGFLDGELVTGISGVRYGTDYGFVGLFITRPDLRYQGHGRTIWSAAMDRLQGRTIGLDGVPEQQKNYQSKGYAFSYGTTRYSGVLQEDYAPRTNIQPITPDMHSQLHLFDRLYFPSTREDFLTQWIEAAHCRYAYVDDGEIYGFGLARECRQGYKIGPLFARDLKVATSLVIAVGASCDGEIHIDVPDFQHQFSSHLIACGFTPGFSTARMYKGPFPAFAEEGVYAVTSLELG